MQVECRKDAGRRQGNAGKIQERSRKDPWENTG